MGGSHNPIKVDFKTFHVNGSIRVARSLVIHRFHDEWTPRDSCNNPRRKNRWADGCRFDRYPQTAAPRWLRCWPESKVVSVSRKDRSAIWLAGGVGKHIYWFDTTESRATSSTAFREVLPDWVRDFNRDNDLHDWVGRTWTSELEAGRVYPGVREDDFDGENESRLGRAFPHALPADPEEALLRLLLTPWMDEWVLDLARRAVESLDLGGDDTPDLLTLSLGATDEIGHLFAAPAPRGRYFSASALCGLSGRVG